MNSRQNRLMVCRLMVSPVCRVSVNVFNVIKDLDSIIPNTLHIIFNIFGIILSIFLQPLDLLIYDIVKTIFFLLTFCILLKNLINRLEIKRLIPSCCFILQFLRLIDPVTLLNIIIQVGTRLGERVHEGKCKVLLDFKPHLVTPTIIKSHLKYESSQNML